MRIKLVAVTGVVLAMPALAGADITCGTRTPAAIAAPAAGSAKCQGAMAKAGAKYLGDKLKVLAKCRLTQPAGSCPTGSASASLGTAVAQAEATIAKSCGDDTAQAGLASSYSSGVDDAVISSCMLSQHSVVADFLLAELHGVTVETWPLTGDDRDSCIKEISKSGTKFFQTMLKNATKCLGKQIKAGTAGDLSPICLGSLGAGGAFVAPSEPKTAPAQQKALDKMNTNISKKCTPVEAFGQIGTIFACPGAASVADLQQCIVCDGVNGVFDVAEQEYAERGTYVANGPAGALQTAVTAAAPGDKLLIGSGTYQEEVTVSTANLSLVGCGAHKDARPHIIPPATEVSGNGIQASAINGLVFQSLDFFNQSSNHIRVAQANGVTFRDITGDGNRRTSYATFPVNSNNVLVELCNVRSEADAPIYVGQSSTIVVRHNQVRLGVSAIEIENSGNAQVYDNYGAGNTGGLLVFKDGSLPTQLGQCHSVHHNLFENNNEPNYGMGTVSKVPTGTGILVLSTDSTPYSYNISRGNNTAGLILTDQMIAGFGPPYSSDESIDNNAIVKNWLTGNGLSPDPVRYPLPSGADIVFLASQSSGNCENGNTYGTETGFGTFAAAPNSGVCVLPLPAVFPGCPAPPVP